MKKPSILAFLLPLAQQMGLVNIVWRSLIECSFWLQSSGKAQPVPLHMREALGSLICPCVCQQHTYIYSGLHMLATVKFPFAEVCLSVLSFMIPYSTNHLYLLDQFQSHGTLLGSSQSCNPNHCLSFNHDQLQQLLPALPTSMLSQLSYSFIPTPLTFS